MVPIVCSTDVDRPGVKEMSSASRPEGNGNRKGEPRSEGMNGPEGERRERQTKRRESERSVDMKRGRERLTRSEPTGIGSMYKGYIQGRSTAGRAANSSYSYSEGPIIEWHWTWRRGWCVAVGGGTLHCRRGRGLSSGGRR
ncbi:hypothetical protein C8Q73DRAFT_506518 [Cubamyces lactineus]|nr:hypothetical protein C8Q73DRAFT_506518 [Cubamyces lactineus]